MSDVIHDHSWFGLKPDCPACEQIMATPLPAAVDNADVAVWGPAVASVDWLVTNEGCCLICGDETNHWGTHCPTGVTRVQAEWVRSRRAIGLGPAAQR